jgi:hypothetical protein
MRIFSLFFSLSLAVFGSGCFVVSDLDRFQDPCDGDTSIARPFTVSLREMDEFAAGLFVVRAVDSSNTDAYTSRAVAVLDGINLEVDAGETQFRMPDAIPPGPNHTAQVFIDVGRDGFDPREVAEGGDLDPGWTRPLCQSGLFAFTNEAMFQSVEDPPVGSAPHDFRFRMVDFDPHMPGTQKLEAMVIERESGRSVGYYRLPNVDAADFEIVIPGIIEPGREYEVQFYVDVDQDDAFVAPPPEGMDHSWIRFYTHENAASHEFVHLFDFDDLTAF